MGAREQRARDIFPVFTILGVAVAGPTTFASGAPSSTAAPHPHPIPPPPATVSERTSRRPVPPRRRAAPLALPSSSRRLELQAVEPSTEHSAADRSRQALSPSWLAPTPGGRGNSPIAEIRPMVTATRLSSLRRASFRPPRAHPHAKLRQIAPSTQIAREMREAMRVLLGRLQ
jgi:hypothetical protein